MQAGQHLCTIAVMVQCMGLLCSFRSRIPHLAMTDHWTLLCLQMYPVSHMKQCTKLRQDASRLCCIVLTDMESIGSEADEGKPRKHSIGQEAQQGRQRAKHSKRDLLKLLLKAGPLQQVTAVPHSYAGAVWKHIGSSCS